MLSFPCPACLVVITESLITGLLPRLAQPATAGATKSYSTPAKPASPEIPDAGALAKELEAYDS